MRRYRSPHGLLLGVSLVVVLAWVACIGAVYVMTHKITVAQDIIQAKQRAIDRVVAKLAPKVEVEELKSKVLELDELRGRFMVVEQNQVEETKQIRRLTRHPLKPPFASNVAQGNNDDDPTVIEKNMFVRTDSGELPED